MYDFKKYAIVDIKPSNKNTMHRPTSLVVTEYETTKSETNISDIYISANQSNSNKH